MSLTTILSISESLTINDQRFVGQSISRNQKIITAEVLTVVPFIITMSPHKYLRYSQSRSVLNSLRISDRALEQYLNFSATGWVNYIAYQGDMTAGQIAACAWQTASANKSLVLGSLPAIASSDYIVKAGDFCQVGRYAYIATADVTRGSGTTVSIPVHRSLMTALSTPIGAVIGEYGTTATMGGSTYTGITIPVILKEYPDYTLIPIKDDSFVSWNGAFKAMEIVI